MASSISRVQQSYFPNVITQSPSNYNFLECNNDVTNIPVPKVLHNKKYCRTQTNDVIN